MADLSELSRILIPFIDQHRGQNLLLAGQLCQFNLMGQQDTRSYALTTPFALSHLSDLPYLDLAVASDVVESLPKQQAIQWLATLRNQYTARMMLVVDQNKTHHWELTDFLALGLRLHAQYDNFVLYSYAIEDYQFPKDWLNSRFWANPDNFDKYRW